MIIFETEEHETGDLADYESVTNITLEDWEAEQMRDPEFRAAAEELEPEYQEYLRTVRDERRQMNETERVEAEWADEEEASPNDYCGECHCPTAGDHCQQCGLPLCPMCSETGAGFCKNHPDEHFEGYGEDDTSQAEQAKRIAELERQIALLTKRVVSIDDCHMERIEGLETCATINAETIGQVEQLKVAMVEQGMRIEKLEQKAALGKEQRLQVVANAAVITRQNKRIMGLEWRVEKLEAVLANWMAAGKETAIPLFGFDFWGKATAEHYNLDAE